jgi:hypothetical protein
MEEMERSLAGEELFSIRYCIESSSIINSAIRRLLPGVSKVLSVEDLQEQAISDHLLRLMKETRRRNK